jgi:hypothetical protein
MTKLDYDILWFLQANAKIVHKMKPQMLLPRTSKFSIEESSDTTYPHLLAETLSKT